MTSSRTPSSFDRTLPYHEIRRRYPRLIHRMCQVAILSENEAISAIADIQLGIGADGGCEAVAHFGGACRVVQEAWRQRFLRRQLELDHAILSLERSIVEFGWELYAAELTREHADRELRSARRMRAQLESELLIARRRVTRVRRSQASVS